jgi:DNA repair protein RecO (recombination protein O)
VRFEMLLLEDLGFGLDLTQCAVSGARRDLAFVSPKSGRAVTAQAAGSYSERLLRLPRFLTSEDGPASAQDLVSGVTLSGFFLERDALQPHGAALPAARTRFCERLTAIASP